MSPYEPQNIEAKWQKKWIDEKAFRAHDESPKKKYYQLETFPYPSGEGLHIGHPKGYTAEDIHARYMRMRGREVLYTIGWDAFGLPTENYAIKVGRSPREVTRENTDNFRRQVRMFGFSYDWDREIDTSSPEYYKWTQWLFIQLFKKGLAYRAAAKVNWCPKDQTVLANEQVVDGTCERCGSVIEERAMEQWFFKITQYADRLLADLKGLDWPAATVKRQEDWIGKSEGAEISFLLNFKKDPKANDNRGPNGERAALKVFTTRPDTLFGATYLVLAPEHPWVTLAIDGQHDVLENKDEVRSYVTATSHKTDLMRQESAKEKTGVPLKGVAAINPANGEEVPIWVADYVLGSYGTGAIMGVPAHDERDMEFAQKFNLKVVEVVKDGVLVSSGKFDGTDAEKAKAEITKSVGGEMKTRYKIRDWSVSRQRYWGVPIPMIHCDACGIVPVPDAALPVLLPNLENYRPQGIPPLASAPDFINVKCPQCGKDARRDPETLDTFVDSSWYYLRYADPKNANAIFDPEKTKRWLPVDLYVIGAEHTVLHLLYSRFITKFLHDEHLINFNEPFIKLRHQGLIRGADGQKMSKSRGNVVNPDELVAQFGADTVRMYEMFMGPFEDGAPWDPKSILGINRFLARIWKYGEAVLAAIGDASAQDPSDPKLTALLHKTVKKVGEDIEQFKFNTAISALMILLNEIEGAPAFARAEFEILLKILHPFAPHLAQELWDRAGNATYVDFETWPAFDSALIAENTFMLVVQVNGKVRDTIEVEASISEGAAKEKALQSAKVQAAIAGAPLQNVIYVPKKLINIVA